MRDLHDPFLRPDDFAPEPEELQSEDWSWLYRHQPPPREMSAGLAWAVFIFGLLIFFACMFLAFWTAGN